MHFILIKNIRIMKKFGLFFISAFMMVLEGLRDRYIGSLFRVNGPVPMIRVRQGATSCGRLFMVSYPILVFNDYPLTAIIRTFTFDETFFL